MGTSGRDANTVYSEDLISGNRLRGIIIHEYIKHNPQFETATLYRLFLNNNVQFHQCTLNRASVIPGCIRTKKYEDDGTLINLLDEDIDHILVNQKGFAKEGIKHEPAKAYNFHNSRPDRAAGRSTDDGSIFYYEFLEEGQEFSGQITGDTDCINEIFANIPFPLKAKIGKSKSTQYGLVSIDLAPQEPKKTHLKKETIYYMVCESPLIVYDHETGNAIPDLARLTTYLPKGVEVISKQINNDSLSAGSCSFSAIEQFNVQWKAKSDKTPCFDAGSTFRIQATENMQMPLQIGERLQEGFGKLSIYSAAELKSLFDTNENHSLADMKDEEETTELLKSIQQELEKDKSHLKIKVLAVRDSKNKRNASLSKSLISRCLAIVLQRQSKVEESLKELRAHAKNELQRSALYDDLMATNQLADKYASFAEYQLYWISFFTTLRKRQKNVR